LSQYFRKCGQQRAEVAAEGGSGLKSSKLRVSMPSVEYAQLLDFSEQLRIDTFIGRFLARQLAEHSE
jgi:hypothetical protein